MNETVYLETTVISYLTARPTRDVVVAARQELTHQWWQEASGSFELYVSQLVLEEIQAGDEGAARKRMEVVADLPLLEIKPETMQMARCFVEDGPIPTNAVEDAVHIALAASHGMDYLLTWNCAHIANATIRNAIVAIANRQEFECPVICTPEELLSR